MGSRLRDDRFSRLGVAGLAVLTILGLGAVTAAVQRGEVEADHDADDHRIVGELATAVTADTAAAVAAIDDLIETVATSGPAAVERPGIRARIPGATGIAVLSPQPGGPARSIAGDLEVEPDVLALPEVAALLAASRDTVGVRMGPPLGPPGTRRSLLVGSVHSSDGEPLDPAGLSVQARRATTSGWVVASIDPTAILAPHTEPDVVASVSDGAAVMTVPGTERPPSGAPEMGVDVATRRWIITATAHPGAARWPVGAAVAMAVAIVVAVMVVTSLEMAGRRRRRAEQESRRRSEQLRLIGQIAPVLQQSLRLDDVLPVVAVQLIDHFGLLGVTVSVPGATGRPTDLFAVGEPPDPGVPPTLRPPEQADPGESLALALDREGRTVALLRVVVGEPLDRPATDSLWAVSELVTAAIVNTNLYRSQQDAMRRLRELDELKSAFLGTASHELRTPATAISGFASLLSSHWDQFGEEQRQELAERIAANANALDHLVQDLLDFSRLEKGTLRVQLETVRLPELVSQVVGRLAPALGDHRLETELHEVPPVAVDPNGVERIITNLLTNAAKFSAPGTTIRVATRLSEHGAELVIDDEGPGVAPSDRRMIFTRFYRGSGDHVTSTRGVGIGLSVVKEFADQMGAGISVTEAPGGGARFIVAFPTSASGTPVTASVDGDARTKEGGSAQTS